MQSMLLKSLNKALALLLFVFVAIPVSAQISLPGKTTYDKFLSAFWSQNSNASNLVAGVNANAEIPFDNDSITNTFTNKLYQGTLTLTNDPIFRTYDGGSATWYYWNFQTTNGVPMWSNTVSRVGMTETLSNKTIWSPTITNTSEQWNFNIRTNQTTNTVLRVLDILTTNNTAASWLTALGFSEATNQPITGYGTAGYFPYYLTTNTITNSVIYTDGTNIAINNTASPYAALVVGESSLYSYGFGVATNEKISAATSFKAIFRVTPDGVGFAHANIIGARDSENYYKSYMAFFTETKTNGTTDTSAERMRITSDGYIGVGTTTPSAKLAINGGLAVGADTDPGDNKLMVVSDTYIGGTAYANAITATNAITALSYVVGTTNGGTQTFTNYTHNAGGTAMVTNVWVFQNGLFVTNTITQ